MLILFSSLGFIIQPYHLIEATLEWNRLKDNSFCMSWSLKVDRKPVWKYPMLVSFLLKSLLSSSREDLCFLGSLCFTGSLLSNSRGYLLYYIYYIIMHCLYKYKWGRCVSFHFIFTWGWYGVFWRWKRLVGALNVKKQESF